MLETPTIRRGFTLVEMLITLAIIALLMGLLLTGLRAARDSARETRQTSNLRQLFVAWHTYSVSNSEQVLPGFLESGVQQAWKVKYRNASGQEIDPALAQTYTWRLAGFMDFSTELTIGYLESGAADFAGSIYEPGPRSFAMPPALASVESLPGSAVALQPEFGYNAYYLGGWWTMTSGAPSMRFIDAKHPTTGAPVTPVARSLAALTRPENIVVFCASTYSGTGDFRAPEPTASGSAWVVPPWLGDLKIWEIGGDGLDSNAITVLQPQAVPLRRFNMIPYATADGSQRVGSYADFRDMKAWTNRQDLSGTEGFGAVHTEN